MRHKIDKRGEWYKTTCLECNLRCRRVMKSRFQSWWEMWKYFRECKSDTETFNKLKKESMQ